MSAKQTAAINAINNTTSLKYNDYDVTRDWKRAFMGNPGTGAGDYIIYNPNDTSQAFRDPGGKIYGGTELGTFGLKEGNISDFGGLTQNQIYEKYLSPQDYAVQKATKQGVQGDQLNAIKPDVSGTAQGIYNTTYANTPNTNNQSGNIGNANNLANQYAALQGQSPEEQAAQKAIDDQNNAFRTGTQNIGEQPIGMSFISGQQADLEKRNTNLQIPLQQQLANAQEKRRASLDSLKFQLERADTETARQDKLKAEALDEDYRRDVLKADTAKQATQTTSKVLGNSTSGYYTYNPETGETTSIANPGSSKTPSSSDSPGAIKYTPTQIQALKQARINTSDQNASSYFLNTPKEFQDFWQREIASSPSNQNYSATELQQYYTNWYNNIYKKKSTTSRSA